MGISVIVLTHNSERTISLTLQSAQEVSDDIHVVDDFSTDSTLSLVYGNPNVVVVQHAFENYSRQRNWAIDNLSLKYEWELHLDADERLSPELIEEILGMKQSFPKDVAGYYIPRMLYFMGHPIKHGGMWPTWHMRLFRQGVGRCEDREYDQHFYVQGQARRLHGFMIDDVRMTLADWTTRHNNWSDAEVRELLSGNHGGHKIKGAITGNIVEKKRFMRELYARLPLFVRPVLLFFYRYFLRLGFLDGKSGFIFYVLQTFWFRFLIDAKIFESHSMDRFR